MSRKIWVGLILIVLGLGLSLTAFWQEGFPGRIYWNNGPVYLSDQDNRAQADVTPDSVAAAKQTVKKVQVSTRSADITVRRGDHFAVLVDRLEKPYVTVSAMDGLVKVTGDEHGDWSIGVGNTKKHRIIIEIPRDLTLEQLDLVNYTGDIRVSNVKANEFLAQNSTGDTTVNDSKVDQTGFVVNRYGDITFKKTALPKVKAYCRYGDLDIENGYQNVPAKDAAFSLTNSLGDIKLE